MEHGHGSAAASHDQHGGHEEVPGGLSLSRSGFVLSPIDAPAAVGEDGELRFRIQGADGAPLVSFAVTHEQDLHLIVVRSDGAHFRHVHPVLDEATGWWSLPWQWEAAGTYRVFADFAPAGATSMHDGVTLTRMVDVAGAFEPMRDRAASNVCDVAGFTVTIGGELATGSASSLLVTIERDGEPVRALQPYLGAFGHLVALREGDLAYLHVHPEGVEPGEGDLSGPEIAFMAQAPTAGRYLLFLDFKVDDAVHTARFVKDVEPAT